MIVVNRNWLRYLGMPADVVAALEECRGLLLADVDAFAVGYNRGRYTSALMSEPAPRTLLLLGMHDRHGQASSRASIIEIGVTGFELRSPSRSERLTALSILSLLAHPTADAIAAAIYEVTCS